MWLFGTAQLGRKRSTSVYNLVCRCFHSGSESAILCLPGVRSALWCVLWYSLPPTPTHHQDTREK